jgi:hypothetical protein
MKLGTLIREKTSGLKKSASKVDQHLHAASEDGNSEDSKECHRSIDNRKEEIVCIDTSFRNGRDISEWKNSSLIYLLHSLRLFIYPT